MEFLVCGELLKQTIKLIMSIYALSTNTNVKSKKK